MTFDGDSDDAILSTGRRFRCWGRIIGISENGLDAFYGYDGDINTTRDDWSSGHLHCLPDWTIAERRELAAHMIARWRRFAAAADSEFEADFTPGAGDD